MLQLLLFSMLTASVAADEGENLLIKIAKFATMPREMPADWADLTIKERLLRNDWSREGLVCATLVVYVLIFYAFKWYNRSLVSNWIKALTPMLETQFAQVGPRMNFLPAGEMIVTDSANQFATYCTGRVNVDQFVVKFELVPRQNFFIALLEYVGSFFFSWFPVPEDVVEILIQPTVEREGVKAASIDPSIFAVVNKDYMTRSRDDSYFLSLTKTTDSDKLPIEFVFMSEAPEITDILYSKELANAVKGADRVLISLALTDQPAVRPEKPEQAKPFPSIILRLNIAKSKKDLEKTAELVDATINFVDYAVERGHWRPEVARKVKTTRDTELKKIEKEINEKAAEEAREKKAELLREAKRKQPTADAKKAKPKKTKPKMVR